MAKMEDAARPLGRPEDGGPLAGGGKSRRRPEVQKNMRQPGLLFDLQFCQEGEHQDKLQW